MARERPQFGVLHNVFENGDGDTMTRPLPAVRVNADTSDWQNAELNIMRVWYEERQRLHKVVNDGLKRMDVLIEHIHTYMPCGRTTYTEKHIQPTDAMYERFKGLVVRLVALPPFRKFYQKTNVDMMRMNNGESPFFGVMMDHELKVNFMRFYCGIDENSDMEYSAAGLSTDGMYVEDGFLSWDAQRRQEQASAVVVNVADSTSGSEDDDDEPLRSRLPVTAAVPAVDDDDEPLGSRPRVPARPRGGGGARSRR